MGGRVGVHVLPSGPRSGAERDCERVLGRLGAWATRLTRFTSTSDLARLNADPRSCAPVRPTLAAVLDWGRGAEAATDSIVNIAMLEERLAAEDTLRATTEEARATSSLDPTRVRASDAWSMDRGARETRIRRPVGLRFDLDGVAKGWLADRALALLDRYAAAVVDADGDVAVRLDPGQSWWIGVGDPRDTDVDLATLRFEGEARLGSTRFGIATSGTSVHRWNRGDRPAHHLIDPRTGQPADTDVVQATVIARSAREAEAHAKTAVILGSTDGLAALDRPSIDGALLLTDRGDLLMLPRTLRYLP